MPAHVGLIKYPVAEDTYGAEGYQEPDWWRDLATTTYAQINEGVEESRQARTMPLNADVDTFRGADYAGPWSISSAAVHETVTGLPEGAGLGELFVHQSTGFQTYREYRSGNHPRTWDRGVIQITPLTWSGWRQVAHTDDVPEGGDAATGAVVRRDRARSRKGGRIGTGGRGVVTLRFDDAHDAMASTVMPLLRQYQLPAYQAVTVRNVEENSARTWSQIQALVADGVEVFGHSWTHQAASGYGNIRKEIIDSAAYMEEQMPGIAIEGWVMPGTGQSGTEAYDGFGPGGTVEAFTDTYAGGLILSRYAVPCGSIQGHLMPLTGAPVTGQVHWTFESATLSETQSMVQQAVATGTGITLMAHPSRFGTSGYMSVADLDALLAWLAAERDAERLLVLTGTGQAFADSSTSERMNVVPRIDHGLGWSGPNWSFTNGRASTSAADGLTYSAAAVGVNHLRGSVLEVTALVNAPTGAVFRMNVGGGVSRTSEHTIPSGGWHRARMFVHYPTTAGVSAGITAAFARVSGGTVTITDVAVQPV